MFIFTQVFARAWIIVQNVFTHIRASLRLEEERFFLFLFLTVEILFLKNMLLKGISLIKIRNLILTGADPQP